MPSLGSGLSLGTANSLPGYDFDVSAFIQQAGVSPTATTKDFTGVTAPGMTNIRLQGTATGLTLSATEDFTLCGWFNLLTPSSNFLTGFGNLFKIYQGGTGLIVFEYGNINLISGSAVPPGIWFHVAVTSFRSGGGAQSHKMYINGLLVVTLATSVTQTLSNPVFFIGGGNAAEFTTGLIADEVSFFKRALNSTEVSALYAAGDGLSYSEASSAISTNNIYSWYSLSETTGNRLNSVNSSVCPLSPNGGGTIVNAGGWVAPKITIDPRQQLNDFVTGVKSLGIWNNMVCWPLRSSQNAGTGTTAFSLGGLATYNGTLLNNPTRAADGIQTDVNFKTISHDGGRDFGTNPFTYGACLKVQTFLSSPFMGLFPPTATFAAYDAGSNTNAVNPNSTGLLDVLIRNNSTAGGTSRVTVGTFIADAFGFATATRNGNALSTFLNNSSNGTSSSLAAGVNFTRTDTQSFITSRENNSASHGLTTMAFAFLIKGQAINPSSLYTLYKTTLGQGLGLP